MASRGSPTPYHTDAFSAPRAQPHPDFPVRGPLVVLHDPDPVRAARVKVALSRAFHVIYQPTLRGLTECCRCSPPVAAVLSFPSPAGNPDQTEKARAALSSTLEYLRAFRGVMPIVLYADTGQLPIALYCQPLAAGARQILNEAAPSFLDVLQETVQRLVQDHLASKEEQHELSGLFACHGLIARSSAMYEVFRRAIRASTFSDLPVLLLGDRGTGKQRLAEAIHALDPVRRDRPFVTVNCGAISKTLAESELFGHARGAFSGASTDRPGIFRAADGGTLLLDEVGELDLELQVKLLRVLQDRRFLPVGEDCEHPVDVRIIAATNRPLDQMIATGRFREDLHDRLNVFRIEIPPLRQRLDDIEVQACYFLELYQDEAAPGRTGFDDRAREALRSLPWPGNTRELENLVREILAHSDGRGEIGLDAFPTWVHARLAAVQPSPAQPAAWPEISVDSHVQKAWELKLSLNEAVAAYEKHLLQKTLEATEGNRTRAASLLGLTPRTVFNKIRKYQLDL